MTWQKKSELNSIIEEQMQPLEKEVDSISDSLVRNTFELQETSEVVQNHFWHVGDSTQPRTSQNINILEYEYEEGYDYRFSGRMNYNQNYYCIAYLDTNKHLISLQYKGETNGANIWDDKPLTIPQGTAYICLQQSKFYKNAWKLEKEISETFDFGEMQKYLAQLDGKVTDNETSIRSLKNKLMKVSISDGQIIVRTKYSENDDFLLLMKLYDSKVQSLTFDSYYIADKDMEDDDIISSNELKIGNIRDSIGAIGTNFGWLFAQHGWTIPLVPIGSNTVTSEDVGSIWEANGKRFILGHYSDYIYMFPECTYNDSLQVWEPSWAHDGVSGSPYNDSFPTSFTHVSGAVHTDPITGGSSDYRARVQLSERKYIVDGVEVGNGVYYCDDFTFDEFVKGINPAKVDPTYFIGSTAQSNIDWGDENLMLKFGRSFSFKGMSVNYHQFIDCVNPFLVRLYYGCIPQMPLKRIETFEDESSVTYNSYTFIPKVKAVKNSYPVCQPFPSNGSNLQISIKRSVSDLFDKDDVPERCVAFLRDGNNGNYKIGMAGGFSLIDGFTKKSERNNYINDQTTQEVLSYSYGNSSVWNKFYPHAIDGSVFEDNVMLTSFIKDFCCYYSWFNPNENEENVFAYVYKAADCYVVYIHAFTQSNKVAVVLPAYLEGMNFDSMIEKTDGATLLTNVVSCNKLYCKFESFGSSNERTDNYLVFKVK